MSATLIQPPAADAIFETNVPPRLDRLPWSGFHWLVMLFARHRLDAGRPEGDGRRSVSSALSESPRLT